MALNQTKSLDPQLLKIATSVRSIFGRILYETMDTSDLSGSCGHASVILKKALDNFTSFTSRMRGGDGRLDGGYIDGHGIGHVHYWLEVTTSENTYIVDITADQFGGPAVTILSVILKEGRKTFQPLCALKAIQINRTTITKTRWILYNTMSVRIMYIMLNKVLSSPVRCPLSV